MHLSDPPHAALPARCSVDPPSWDSGSGFRTPPLEIELAPQLQAAVTSCFRCAAPRGLLKPEQLPKLRSTISQVLSVPEPVLADMRGEFLRFDFRGEGCIDSRESYRLAFCAWVPRQVGYFCRSRLKSLAALA